MTISRRRLLGHLVAVVGLLAALAVAAPATAHHKPGHGGGPTTTAAPATTTTTIMATSTTTTLGPCSGPLTINAGGSYSGCFESTDPEIPAVTIATTQPVTLERVHVRHAGFGVFAQATTDTQVTITNSTFMALAPGPVTFQRAVYLLQPESVIIEHNQFVNGHGILLNGDNLSTTTLRIRYNDYLDIGRYDAPELVGAVHFDKVLASAGAEIAWNRVCNHYGRSYSEDVIGLHESNGGGSSAKIEVHHNLIDGSYPYSGDGAGFTGGGIDLGDSSGSWQLAHDNTVVRVTNNGLMIPSGTDLEHHSNRVVTSGIADDGTRVSSTFGNGLNLWDNPSYAGVPARVTMHDNTGDHRRWTGSAWERSWQNTAACDPSDGCGNNTSLGLSLSDDGAWLAEIADALADWETARVAAGVTIGPA